MVELSIIQYHNKPISDHSSSEKEQQLVEYTSHLIRGRSGNLAKRATLGDLVSSFPSWELPLTSSALLEDSRSTPASSLMKKEPDIYLRLFVVEVKHAEHI